MKRLLLATALALGLSTAARAEVITVTGYSTPDNFAFGSVTTDGYSYYTGPVMLQTSIGNLLVYCADLDHILHTGQYIYAPLTLDGRGDPLSVTQSSILGQLAEMGFVTMIAGTPAGQTFAAAIQAAIWDTEYGIASTTSDPNIAADLAALTLPVGNGQRALALIPFGQDWWQSASASQQMIVGLAVPEPASAAILGVALLGAITLTRRRQT